MKRLEVTCYPENLGDFLFLALDIEEKVENYVWDIRHVLIRRKLDGVAYDPALVKLAIRGLVVVGIDIKTTPRYGFITQDLELIRVPESIFKGEPHPKKFEVADTLRGMDNVNEMLLHLSIYDL